MTKQTPKSRPPTPCRLAQPESEPVSTRRTKKKLAKKSKRPKNIWSPDEDKKLLELIDVYGPAHWSTIASSMEGREGKQCRERWHNHLNPAIMKDSWTEQEDLRLFLLYKLYGSKWSVLSFMFAGRTDNSIKNHWNSIMKKKVRRFEAYVKGVVESGDYTGLDRLDVDLVERIRRAEFDNKNCRKGRTRNYKGFFEKNRLIEYVNMSELEAEEENWDKEQEDRPQLAPAKARGDRQAGMGEAGQRGTSEGRDIGGRFEKAKAGPQPPPQFEAQIGLLKRAQSRQAPTGRPCLAPSKSQLQDPHGGRGISLDRSISPDQSSRMHHSWFSFGMHQDFRPAPKVEPIVSRLGSRDQIASTAKKGSDKQNRFCSQMTPTSLISKMPRGCGLETTANNAKYEGGTEGGEQNINLCVTSFFACHEMSAMKSPLIQLGSQSEISDVFREGTGNYFKGLVTPTKGVFDFSNGKFADSRSSARHGSAFSNLKSLDISKSLEYS